MSQESSFAVVAGPAAIAEAEINKSNAKQSIRGRTAMNRFMALNSSPVR